VNVDVEVLSKVNDEVVEAFERLLPQLSTSAKRLDSAGLSAIATSAASTVLLARVDKQIVGTLTLVTFAIPSGVRAWIEDVVVDEASRGKQIASTLIDRAVKIAKQTGARTVDLTSRPSRESAGRLYERLGFEQRETRMYRYKLS
jgi:ribosomal protein S18 acetylase RimI-like enzyme